ncbi:RNA polymerase sigma-70 factor, ECF subfamily [Thermomonospora echinospora]|uniref:RNA polymerase sigma-70 factor, ECF subfamily n=1 Tax=Thermomonospora echinospora TaxID=1992 RepID=A0A1H5VRG2_9ACTN|nr:sigma factor [Thermomonospora echinospora]SEF89733.1 RNA polymerase sigma-70 factor, ECF subfamily [Thermomonospora echinospora]
MRLRRSAERTRLDDEVSLRAAYDEHAGELFAFAERSLGERALAEEAVRETFLRAWRSAARLDAGEAVLRTWLLAICRNVVIEHACSRRTARVADGTALERLLTGLQVEEALRRLSPDHRAVLVELHVLARPPAAVAAELRIPAGTVRNRTYYALRALRLALEEMGWEA